MQFRWNILYLIHYTQNPPSVQSKPNKRSCVGQEPAHLIAVHMLFAVWGESGIHLVWQTELEYQGTKGNPKIWLTYSQFKFPRHLTDSFNSIPFNNFEWFNHVQKGKDERTPYVLCDLLIIGVFVLCCVRTLCSTFGGRSHILYLYLLCLKKNIPLSTNYNKAHSNQKEIKTEREQLPSNYIYMKWRWSECETCGPKVIVYFPNEQLNQGYAKIEIHCNSIKKIWISAGCVLVHLQCTISVCMWFHGNRTMAWWPTLIRSSHH